MGFHKQQNLGEDLVSPSGLGCCPFLGDGSVVGDFLFIVTPIVGVCNFSIFCCTLLYVHSIIHVKHTSMPNLRHQVYKTAFVIKEHLIKSVGEPDMTFLDANK